MVLSTSVAEQVLPTATQDWHMKLANSSKLAGSLNPSNLEKQSYWLSHTLSCDEAVLYPSCL